MRNIDTNSQNTSTQKHSTLKIIIIFILFDICVGTTVQKLALASLHSAQYVLNLKKLSNCSALLQIQSESQSRLLLNSTLRDLSSSTKDGLKRLDIYNIQDSDQVIYIRILNSPNSNQTVQLQQIIAESITKKQDLDDLIIMFKQNVYEYILPFNLLSQKHKKLFIEENYVNITSASYNYQPFLETFWNQRGMDELLLTWIPYFSRCQNTYYKRIFFKDVIDPYIRSDLQLQEVNKICQSTQSWFWGNTLTCQQKNIHTKCILEELNVKNTKKQPWWMNTNNILYYFLKSTASNIGFSQMVGSKEILDSIAEQYYDKLIPLEYFPQFDLNTQNPNHFLLRIQIGSLENVENLQILRASLYASRLSNLSLADDQSYLNIKVKYLSNIQTLLAYGKQTYVYFVIFICLACVIIGLCLVCLSMRRINLHFTNISKLILFPISKGFIMGFLTSTLFVVLFYYLAANTKYEAISSTFDVNYIQQSWSSYAGRVGFNTFMAGYFLLGMAINQAFKVLTPDQTKIIIEDDMIQRYGVDYKKNSALGEFSEDQENQQNKQNFIIKNMNSHRKYLFFAVFAFSFFLLFLYSIQLHFSFSVKIVFLLIICPIIHKLIITIYRHLIIKQLLYLTSVLMSFETFIDLFVIGHTLMWETIVFYFCKIILENVLYLGVQVLAQLISVKAYSYIKNHQRKSTQPSNLYKFLNYYRSEIESIINQCRYQKSIFYSNLISIRFSTILVRPFLVMIIFITIKYNFICKDMHQTAQQFLKTGSMILCFSPIDVFTMIFSIKFFQKNFGLEIIKCLEFNKFKFNRRKAKWMNDTFVQNRCIQYFYREFEKFCFSSQLYIHTFTVTFSIFSLMIGMKIILQVQYISFVDPAMLLILCIVWVTGNIGSLIINFVVIKLKFYERKQDTKTRAKLQNIQKILKKSDYSQYLQTQAVKYHFLFHCKQWIVQNITKIFEKQDFFDNNYQLLMKYKNYKSLLKKKQIEQRKKKQKGIEDKINQINRVNQKDKNMVVKLPKKQFEELAKPLICSWLYMAKQFTYLKSLVSFLKQERKKQTCQFCSMNIELEVIERNQFISIVNQYRVLNVGRMFSQRHFIEFYKVKQDFITVCIQCKDKKFYYQKRHLDMNFSSPQRRLLYKWLIIARSRILNKKNTKEIKTWQKIDKVLQQ